MNTNNYILLRIKVVRVLSVWVCRSFAEYLAPVKVPCACRSFAECLKVGVSQMDFKAVSEMDFKEGSEMDCKDGSEGW